MPLWLTVLLILVGIIVIMLILICVVKFNKKIDSKVDIPDKASVALKIENDAPQKSMITFKQSEEQYEFIKTYVLSMIESNFLLTTVFYGMQNKEDLSDKIYLKYILTRTDSVEESFEHLNKDVCIIQKLIRIYVHKIQDKIEQSLKFIEENLDDIDSIYNLITEISDGFENDTFLTNAIAEFKNKGFKADLFDGKQISISPEKMNDELFQRFKTKVKTSSVSFISEIKLTKTRLLSVENKIVRVLSVMHCINDLCDAITKHIYVIYFECKPAVIGSSKGV